MNCSDDAVLRLRSDFLTQAILQIRRTAASGDDDASAAAQQLRQYCESVKEDFSPEIRNLLAGLIQTLPR